MGLFSKYNKTNFEGGGCMLEDIPLGAETVEKDKNFIAPRKIDYRDMLLPTNDQGQTPHCVGYSTAGMVEFWHWKKNHFPKQFDGDAIYAEAKRLDGSPNVKGTWPKYGIKAAMNLGFISGKPKYVDSSIQDIKFTLHEYSVFVGGFMITTDWNIVDKKTGFIKNSKNAQKRGGHAVCIAGYSDNEGLYIHNSWSVNWGIYGFAILGWEQVEKQFMNGIVIIPD
jgi:hypothetical protein